ncbi:MAG: nitroreductase family deazaflavin-dependent oxidoreductase [Candidatus Limnocylindrales bacterium]
MGSPPTRLHALASFVTHWVDPLLRPFADVLPGFCVLTHVGRRSGRVYRTPLNVFRRRDRVVFALTYGSGAEWVRNVLAAGACDIRTMRRDLHLVRPEVVVDAELRDLPWLPRVIERANRVSEILVMRVAEPTSAMAAHERRRAR